MRFYKNVAVLVFMLIDHREVVRRAKESMGGVVGFGVGSIRHSRYKLSPNAKRAQKLRDLISYFAITLGIITMLVVAYLFFTQVPELAQNVANKIQPEHSPASIDVEVNYIPKK